VSKQINFHSFIRNRLMRCVQTRTLVVIKLLPSALVIHFIYSGLAGKL